MARKDRSSLVCPLTNQFKDLYSCALNCRQKCIIYKDKVTLARLQEFVDKHPDYIIIGELMATKTKSTKEKRYWIVFGDNQYREVSEKEIMANPQEFIDMQIWDKPPNKYELVISLKRVKV
ncbi:MAG: hypothetical protein K8R90_11155 [Candidatus Cloacimonetes bacterium]|nr:hypothetical protein [Candidatus Cloacimonadota bacterium]